MQQPCVIALPGGLNLWLYAPTVGVIEHPTCPRAYLWFSDLTTARDTVYGLGLLRVHTCHGIEDSARPSYPYRVTLDHPPWAILQPLITEAWSAQARAF
ncbi:hypothetical protein [Anthocerotibacter panamensis]|uniref:hypothetical protein n=1 Tax=Anthocerotibacter panamensis TaxID=2857077 RepID=UPI001C404C94|nr:hypothetical protein [Anthocerotibacter panamensis]